MCWVKLARENTGETNISKCSTEVLILFCFTTYIEMQQ